MKKGFFRLRWRRVDRVVPKHNLKASGKVKEKSAMSFQTQK